MRILLYHPRATIGDGGITNSVRQLAMGLARAGADPIVLSADDAPPLDLLGVECRQIPHRQVGPFAAPIGRRRAVADADVIVMNSSWTLHNVLMGRTARGLGIPYVLAPRGAYDPKITRRRRAAKRVWWRLGERALVLGARAVHIFFEPEREHLRALGYDGPVIVAPNGVAVPEGLRWRDDGDYLLYLGRFDPEHKGLDVLLRAVASAQGSLPVLRMHGSDWAGGKERLRALIAELGIGDRVVIGDHLLGDEKWEAFVGAAGFVYPSRWEAFGNSAAEAAALGVPTLVTPYPLGCYLAERGAAVLADGTVPSLADGLKQICSPGAARMGARAAELVQAEFTWDAVASTWLIALRGGGVTDDTIA